MNRIDVQKQPTDLTEEPKRSKPQSDKTVKKLKNRKLATYENPTIVVPESTNRPLLRKALKKTFLNKMLSQDKAIDIDFSKRTSRNFDFFQVNVLFNKHLTVADVKLAIYFHNIFHTVDDKIDFRGLVFIVRPYKADIDLARGYGELGGIYIKDNYHSKEPAYYDELQDFYSLIHASKNLIGSESPTELNKTIQRLHDYGYITVTDITPENQAIPIPGKSDKPGVIRRVRLKHIRLCKWMVFNKVFYQLEGM